MTAASSTTPRTGRVRLVALATATTVVATACVLASAPAAGAATLPQAQSVGNFLDATLGGKVIDPVLKLKYATAKSPGQQSVQNPLDATVLNAATIPLTGKAQLPSVAGIKLGAVN